MSTAWFRAVSNPLWDVDAYVGVLTWWLRTCPRGTWEGLLGPWAKTSTVVSHVTLTRGLPLLRRFIEEGQRACVLHGARLEAGIARVTHQQPGLISPGEDAVEVASRVANHIMALAATLRVIGKELKQPPPRYST